MEKYIQAFKISDGTHAYGPQTRYLVTADYVARFIYNAEVVAGESVAIYVCPNEEAPSGGAALVATIISGEIVGIPQATSLREVSIGLTLNSVPIENGWLAISSGATATVQMTISITGTVPDGDYTLPITTPTKLLPLNLTFTSGEASKTLNTSAEAGEYAMEPGRVAQYLAAQYPNKSWIVTGGATVVIV